MHGEPGFSRFFACLSLFIFSMLGIVLANNFIQIFVFWELVGLSSYLLIGYYFEKPSASDAAKKALIKDYEHLVIELRKRRWDLEKLAQHEFAFIRFTLRSMENLNRKIKVEAIKLKEEVVPKETPISKKIKQGILDPKDFKLLAKLILKGIDRISKDVRYSSKLISKFENKIKKLRKIMESLKNSVNNLAKKNKVSEETQKKLKEAFDSWDSAIKSLDEEVNKDLMQIFRNIFVEYKYIGTRQLKAA